MYKKTIKLVGLFFLLLLSFVYTDKVFSSARKNDPIMKQVIKYKKEKDIMPTEPVIKGNEMVLGYAGLIVNEEKSYKKMKEKDKFDEDMIVYEKKLPKTTISNTYKYYIKQGNITKKEVALIFKITDSYNIDELLKRLTKQGINASFFVDGAWLENNIETAFSIANCGIEIYNLGYNNSYNDTMITVTNNLIESITLKDSLFCLNDSKNDVDKKVCDKKKMISLTSTLQNPSIIELKEGLEKGVIISYDINGFDIDNFNLIINTITSRGYNIEKLSKVISE